MSLIDSSMEDAVLIEKVRIPDGEGGFVTTWKDGARFKSAITFDASLSARIAEAQGVKNVYTVTTRKNTVLSFHDVFKRVSDGKVFRVTSDGEDSASPKGSTLSIRQVSAEEWSLTT